jgi:predicted aspartyl protease
MALLRLVALIVLIFAGSNVALADERYAPLAQMPFEINENGAPMIAAQVNDEGPFYFVLDTGATGTTIRPPLVARLRPPKMARELRGLQGMGGETIADLYRLDSIAYGPLRAENILAPLFEQPKLRWREAAGVAGIDILRGHAVEFDFPARALRLHRRFSGGRGWRRVASRFNKAGYAFIPFSVNGISGEGFLDTGAATTILNPAFAGALGLRPGDPRLTRTASVGGIEGARIPLYAGPTARMSLGGRPLPSAPPQFADLPIFDHLAPPGGRLAILGSDLLAHARFVIDYPGRAVWLHTP